MATKDNNQQTQPNGSNGPMYDLTPGSQLEKDIHIIAEAMLKEHPDLRDYNIKRAPTESQSNYSESRWKMSSTRPGEEERPAYRSRGNLLEDFENGIKDQLLDSLAGGNFKKGIQGALTTFQKEFGFDLRNIGHEAGKAFSKKAADIIKNSPMGQKAVEKAKELGDKALTRVFKDNPQQKQAVKDGLSNVWKSFRSGGQSSGKINGQAGNFISDLAGKAGGKFGTVVSKAGSVVGKVGGKIAASGAGKAVAGVAGKAIGAVASMNPIVAAIVAAIALIVAKIFGPLFKGVGEMVKALGKSFNREEEMRKKMLENAKKRQEEDMKWLAERPFRILEEAATKWADTWDANLAKVALTQGYTKEDVYDVYEGYATRLRDEGLDAAIKATDVVEKLSTVLDSGLSGQAAEEFAYIATKLNAAIPTQDFFAYSDTYASIAANAMAQGMSQAEALNYANKQLEDFASNLLYSSRELAGGFATGLKNGSNLFKEATQIAQAAKTYNATDISGTLTSVSAIVGAVAPDLADSLVSNVVQAAVGGNSSQIVALRSLAGINAGNTEFLRALAEDPQSVFSSLFTNLAQMQSMSPDNYMEVAEGLAEVFGIDKNALARVDFNYLAQAISAMNTNSQTLEENLALLESGQATTSAEQLKAQEINRIILDEGLAYVIDSEAGRMVQQHMWDEQRTNALLNAEYAVSLQGAALSFLEGIRKTITNILNFLNPIGFIAKGIANMVATASEAAGNEKDLKEILLRQAVGSNSTAFSNLTTRGKDLGLVQSYVEMIGGSKGIGALNVLSDIFKGSANMSSNLLGLPSTGQFNQAWDKSRGGLDKTIANIAGANKNSAVRSRYDWSFVGKSFAQAIQDTPMNSNTVSSVARAAVSATQTAQDESNRRFQEFLDTAEEASKSMSYEHWVATAKDKGISDFSEALNNYGKTEEEIRGYFESNQAQQGAKEEVARKADEQLFRNQNREFWGYNNTGIFQTAFWIPFFGDGQKYDTRMSAVDRALSHIQTQLGNADSQTVIGGLEELSRKMGEDTTYTVIGALEQIRSDISNTFVSTSSVFQRCLADWTRYIQSKSDYNEGIGRSSAWSELQAAEKDQQTQATLALANALGVFSADELKKLDPQLQANVLLGEILVVLQAIMQQNNTAAGGLTLLDTFGALGTGLTVNLGG